MAISSFQQTSIATYHAKCDIVHMVQITIRDLHMKTGEWVRKVADAESIVVMDRLGQDIGNTLGSGHG